MPLIYSGCGGIELEPRAAVDLSAGVALLVAEMIQHIANADEPVAMAGE